MAESIVSVCTYIEAELKDLKNNYNQALKCTRIAQRYKICKFKKRISLVFAF